VTNDGKDAQQARSAQQNLHHMWQTFCLAQEMGKGVGRGQILL
jgi:hypothetical protein